MRSVTSVSSLLGLMLLLACGFGREAISEEGAAGRGVRLGFEAWPDDGAAGASGGDGRARLVVTAPAPKAEGARRRFNVRSAGSFPVWGWKPGRYQELWSATGDFTLRVEAPPWNDRPAGVYPSVIKFRDEAQACLGGRDFLKPRTGFDYYDEWRGNIPWMLLALAMYQVTDDAQFLGMIEDSLRWVRDNEPNRRKLGKVYSEVREQCSWVFPAWRVETGRDTYDKVFADSMDMVAAGEVATWGKAIEAQRWLVEQLSKNVLGNLAANYPMFTSEVVFTDPVYVRGIDLLEPVLYGLPNGRGFGLPLFRATAQAPAKVAWSCLVTKKDRLAVLAANADGKPQEMTLRPVHLPAGEYVMKVYDPDELIKPLSQAPVRVEHRLQPIKVGLPEASERLIVTELERRAG